MNKIFSTADEAVADIPEGSVIAVSGFFAAGVPRGLLQALIRKGTKHLTFTCGCGPLVGAHEELLAMVRQGQVDKVIDSYGLFRSASKGLQDPFEQAIREGKIELEVVPMGTLAERYRAAGAGIPAFYTPTGIGSIVEKSVATNIPARRAPKETRVIDGEKYILEYALKPDYAFIHANKADQEGNLRYRLSARNFAPVMATAARVTIAEVENIVDIGKIEPDDIHTAGIYVNRVVYVPRPKFAIRMD